MIRVLIVDDSAMVRTIWRRILSADPAISVVGEAPDPYVARDLIVALKPDVVTLDVEMPRMDGITFLRKLMRYYPLPVVVCSTLTAKGGEVALEAMNAGAVEVICKPSSGHALGELNGDLLHAVRTAALARFRTSSNHAGAVAVQTVRSTQVKVLAIGASTGGTVAIESILLAMPENIPGTVIVQHMPAFFTKSFADRLNKLCRVKVKEAEEGDPIVTGQVLVAPGDHHLLVRSSPQGLVASLREGPRVSGHRPSVDVMFRSVAKTAGRRAVGVILTGMGADGAAGLRELRNTGARTLGQDEDSCVVYGMPKVAAELGGVEQVVGLEQMPFRILATLEG